MCQFPFIRITFKHMVKAHESCIQNTRILFYWHIVRWPLLDQRSSAYCDAKHDVQEWEDEICNSGPEEQLHRWNFYQAPLWIYFELKNILKLWYANFDDCVDSEFIPMNHRNLGQCISHKWFANRYEMGPLRQSLFRDLRCVADLEKHLKEVDSHYDLCNDAWAQGEADKFTGEKLPSYMIL